jgi:hypothetical protein
MVVMSVLIINPEKQAEIKAAIEEARAHPLPWEIGKQMMVAATDSVGLADRRPDAPARPPETLPVAVIFDGGVRANISFEYQEHRLFRHLSMSTRDGRKLLHPMAAAMVAKEFGIDLDLSGEGHPLCGRIGKLWREEYEPGRWAISVIVLEVEHEGGHA